MAIMPNKPMVNSWVEKELKKKKHTTESAYEHIPIDERDPYNMKKPKKRYTKATSGIYVKTLRGIRK